MSLLKPTPGQLVDRLVILHLKIYAHGSAGKDVSQLLQERSEIEESLGDVSDAVLELVNHLTEVNRKIWDCEDRVRSLPSTAVLDLARVAKEIPKLNDERNHLIRQIDAAYGCAEPTE